MKMKLNRHSPCPVQTVCVQTTLLYFKNTIFKSLTHHYKCKEQKAGSIWRVVPVILGSSSSFSTGSVYVALTMTLVVGTVSCWDTSFSRTQDILKSPSFLCPFFLDNRFTDLLYFPLKQSILLENHMFKGNKCPLKLMINHFNTFLWIRFVFNKVTSLQIWGPVKQHETVWFIQLWVCPLCLLSEHWEQVY